MPYVARLSHLYPQNNGKKIRVERMNNTEQRAFAGLPGFLPAHQAMADAMLAQLETADRKMNDLKRRIAKLEKLATTDELTGLTNRRGFDEAFSKELGKVERGVAKGGVLLLIDIDNFKMINDTYGHAAGDAALQMVARTLRSRIRYIDTAARMGGDEFVVILSGADKHLTTKRAQQLAWLLSRQTLQWKDETITVRSSVGMRSFGQGEQAEQIYIDTDAALYASKESRKEQMEEAM